jgi:hypothetical protein
MPLERAFLFLATLQQLGIDGCLVALPGKPGAFDFWIGVLADKEIYLFDTRMGMPLPGPDGRGVATLRHVRTASDPFAALHIDDKHRYDVSADQIKQLQLQVSLPLSALAPRMKQLEQLLGTNRIRLAIDLTAVRERFQNALQDSEIPIRIDSRAESWQPASPLRVLRRSVSETEVSRETSIAKFRAEKLIPWRALPGFQSPYAETEFVKRFTQVFGEVFQQFPLPPMPSADDADISHPKAAMARDRAGTGSESIREDRAQRFVHLLFQVVRRHPDDRSFTHFALLPNSPRDDMLRGRFDEATVKLVDAAEQLRLQNGLFSPTEELDRQMSQWLKDAVTVQAELLRMPAGSTKSDQEPALRRRNELLFGNLALLLGQRDPESARPGPTAAANLPLWLRVSLKIAAQPLSAEASYLLALCKHEQAERLQLARGTASETQLKSAWRTADHWWTQFLEEHPTSPQVAAARICKGKALEALGDSAGATGQWQNLAGSFNPLEETARLYRAKALGK